MSPRRKLRRASLGLTLIELIMFIVIVGVALVGVLSVLNVTVFHSADPMARKQMLAIAESLLEEVEMQSFTYCDPYDPNVTTATGATTVGSTVNCQTWVQGLNQPKGESRTSTTTPFNNVGDYFGLVLPNPITDVSGNNQFAGYSATVTLTANDALGPAGLQISSNGGSPTTLNTLRISVTVTKVSDGSSITLEGYRTRYAPNQP